MINLLPPEQKAAYRYAYRNVKLVHWVLAFAFGLVGLVAISTMGLVYMQQETNDYAAKVAVAQQKLTDQKQSETLKQVQEISGNLKLVVQVLSKEVLFSQLLKQLGTIIPSDVVLTNLSITQTSGGIDISAQTSNYSAATQLQVNLADPANKIFSGADIQNINCDDTGKTGKYPCSVTVRALFSANNPYLFINTNKAKP